MGHPAGNGKDGMYVPQPSPDQAGSGLGTRRFVGSEGVRSFASANDTPPYRDETAKGWGTRTSDHPASNAGTTWIYSVRYSWDGAPEFLGETKRTNRCGLKFVGELNYFIALAAASGFQ